MPSVVNKLGHLLSRHASPSRPVRADPEIESESSSTTNDKVQSKTPSSCELFGFFKAIAAGTSRSQEHTETTEESDSEYSELSSPSTLSEQAQRDRLEHRMDADMASIRNEAMGSQLAALSLSNLSPLSGEPTDGPPSQSRPPLPRAQTGPVTSPEMGLPITQETQQHSHQSASHNHIAVSEGLPTGLPSPRIEATSEEKIQAIVEEFGQTAELFEGGEPETMLAECMGSLFKGIMLIGNLHLTTHRLLFHAMLPPDSAYTVEKQEVTAPPDILMSGPVTVHRPGAKTSARRWMELSAEMVTTYPSGDELGRVRPIKCVLLNTVRRMEPLDPLHPCDFKILYEAPTGQTHSNFTVDTEQSAIQWRRAFESAIYRHARMRWRSNEARRFGQADSGESLDDWYTMRCCLPLDRVTVQGVSDYHSFSTLVSLDVQLGSHESLSYLPDQIASGDYSGDLPRHPTGTEENLMREVTSPRRSSTMYIDSTLPPRLASSMTGDNSHPAVDAYHNSYNFNVALLNEQAWFAEALDSAVRAASERVFKSGVNRPKFVLDVAGYDCLATDEDTEKPRSNSSSSSEEELQELSEFRKAEKAKLAAKVFGLKEEDDIWLKRCYVSAIPLPARGHIILTPQFVCFWRRATVGADIKYRYKRSDIKGAERASCSRAGFHGMALKIHGQHDLLFEFWKESSRDEVIRRIQDLPFSSGTNTPSFSEARPTLSPVSSSDGQKHPADILAPPKEILFTPRAFPDEALSYMPFIANKPWQSVARLTPRHFICLTIGSRGDVQPYIALGLRLMKDGHRVTIVTHSEFKGWIEGYGIGHRQAGGDATALMKLSAEHKMFSPGFFKESLGSYRQWFDDLLLDSWQACHDAAVLIESPSTMSGIHIAEALKIPYFRAFTMPWTRTTAYPQAFMVPAFEMGPTFNYSTYVLFDNIIWQATSGQVNKWRKKHLGLKPTDMSSLSITKVPFLYNFSPSVVPKPLDWHDDITITGYWNLENSDSEWTPPPDLEAFMHCAKVDGKKLVYIGFGSIVVPRPNAMTRSLIEAVEKADVRAIIAKGWSSRGGDPAKEGQDVVFPPSCYSLEKVPHGWLFPKIDAALHHGGAGTVGASLRAGIPTLIKPWFGDQFFWGIRVTKLEVGIKLGSLRAEEVANALRHATTDVVMIEKAARVGERIRAENGVENALQAIHFNIGRAASDRTKMTWAK